MKKLRHPPASNAALICSFAIVLAGSTLDTWCDVTLNEFERKLDETLFVVEEAVLEFKGEVSARLLKDRIEQAYHRLLKIAVPSRPEGSFENGWN